MFFSHHLKVRYLLSDQQDNLLPAPGLIYASSFPGVEDNGMRQGKTVVGVSGVSCHPLFYFPRLPQESNLSGSRAASSEKQCP